MEAKKVTNEAIITIHTAPVLPCPYHTDITTLLYSLLLIYDEGWLKNCIN